MIAKPLGFYILIELEEVKNETEWGFKLDDNETSKEQRTESTGRIIAIGPLAYVNWPGCEEGNPAECWGVKVGDLVEFKKYDGVETSLVEHENYRYIPDSHLVGVLSES